ncbi:encapsulin-associated ferritin-like protein [Kiritimatiella glycovorans]|uniref:Ferritin n=1 Tax=Kiritimatiella glycovorans TaxID=1307763 RepID=A0A0G3ELA5_9BACT|nr:ferritin-like domain-containing protein [Kiritimatiella glycovorans]AKJ65550.1 hypothetical protein L21SP4_02324 [Kiritimatiella glycovorans]
MADYHEDQLSEASMNASRALKSVKEEIEAVDWYNQRVDATNDQELAKILAHNRDEEIEHACMVLEWLRRNMPGWDEQMKTYLFTQGDITLLEEEGEGGEEGGEAPAGGDLAIGKIE